MTLGERAGAGAGEGVRHRRENNQTLFLIKYWLHKVKVNKGSQDQDLP